MTARILEFRTTLGSIPSPYFKGDIYFARFSSSETITKLNKILTVFDVDWRWSVSFGRKLDEDGLTIPMELLFKKSPITAQTIKDLKKRWNKSIEHNEPEEARFEMIDIFLSIHCVSKLEMKKYYMDLEALKEDLSPK